MLPSVLRLVHLDKLRLQTRRREAEQDLARGGKDPFIVVKNPSASKGGVAETSIKVRMYILVGFSSSIEGRNGHRKCRLPIPVAPDGGGSGGSASKTYSDA